MPGDSSRWDFRRKTVDGKRAGGREARKNRARTTLTDEHVARVGATTTTARAGGAGGRLNCITARGIFRSLFPFSLSPPGGTVHAALSHLTNDTTSSPLPTAYRKYFIIFFDSDCDGFFFFFRFFFLFFFTRTPTTS